MSLVLKIAVTDNATEEAKALMAAIVPNRDLHLRMAGRVAEKVIGNFDRMGTSEHNPFGAKSSFWDRMASTVREAADDTTGYVAMDRAAALRYFGGTIVPKTTKFLAIPARKETYGTSPTTFKDLAFIALPQGGAALIQRDQTQIRIVKDRRKGHAGERRVKKLGEAGGGVMFWLVRQANIQANPTVLPDDDTLASAAMQGARSYLDAIQRSAARKMLKGGNP